MKFSSILVGAFAALASAAPAVTPAVEARSVDRSFVNSLNGIGGFNVGDFNNFQFNNAEIGYLFGLQGIDINIIAQLVAQQGMGLSGAFSQVFFQQEIDIQAIILISQIQIIQHIAQIGLFSGFDLSSVVLGGNDFFNLGLLNDPFSAVNLQAAINPTVVTQVQTIAIQQFDTFTGVFKE